MTTGPTVSARDGARLGVISGLLGTLGMTIASSILVAIFVGATEGPGAALGTGFIYLLFGSFFACLIGPVGGALIGRTLAVTERTSSAPLVGALTPPVAIIPIVLGWALIDEGSRIDSGVAAIVALAIFYVPFGYLAGKFYARRTAELTPMGPQHFT